MFRGSMCKAVPFINDRDRLRLLVQKAKASGSWTG